MSASQKITGVYTSNARKLIAVVPETTRLVSFPAGATISSYGKGNDSPCLVLNNGTDTKENPNGTWQGLKPGHYAIVNEVTQEAAEAFLATLGEWYTIETLEKALATLASQGFKDQYSTDLAFVTSKLSPAGLCHGSETKDDGKFAKVTCGIAKRDDRDLTKGYRDVDGYVYVEVSGQPRRIEDEILVRTYREADGSVIDPSTVPAKQ